MAKKTVQDLKDKLATFKSVTPWDMIEPNKVYHIPPIITLHRREILVLSKDDEKATYCKVDGTDENKRTMYKTSVFAKFIVKRKKF